MGVNDHFYFLDAVVTVDVLTASNNDVNFVETQTVHFPWPWTWAWTSFRFERINKVDRDFFIFWLPPEIPRDIAPIKSECKDCGYRE